MPRRGVLLVAADAERINEHQGLIIQLRGLGRPVHLGHLTGVLAAELSAFGGHRVWPADHSPAPSDLKQRVAHRALRLAVGATTSGTAPRATLGLAVRLDPWFDRTVGACGRVLALDRAAAAALPAALAPPGATSVLAALYVRQRGSRPAG